MTSRLEPIFQVSEFNELVNNHLNLLGAVTIEGELTRLEIKNNRLIFGSIKDKTSALDIFSMSHLIANYQQFEPGMLVRVVGTAGVYKGTTKFRLMVTKMMPQGEGALQVAFNKLKTQLEKEGLFAVERKRPLPFWPTNIGLITAKNSSTYYDLVKILLARMGGLNVKLLPVNVQGRDAVPNILAALEYINNHCSAFEVIIMARGGGSLDDLQAFNSEEIARAVFALKVPIVSAVGHEDNWSLVDFVADLRASTPSNAAELVVRDKKEVIYEINRVGGFIKASIEAELKQKTALTKSLESRVNTAIKSISSVLMTKVNMNLYAIKQRLDSKLSLMKQEIRNLTRLLESLDYQHVLDRGFSITKNAVGKIIRVENEVKRGEVIMTQLAKGLLTSTISGDK